MAKVYSSVSDFVLFPRDQTFIGALDPKLGADFNNMHYHPDILDNMHQHGDFSAQASTPFESYPPVSTYSSAPSAYFGAPSVPYETQKGNMGRPLQRRTPSGSPSPSNSQVFDHPPSTLSSASGASGQSTASSTDGSPYASATHVLPYEGKWSGPLHGLGIAPGIVSSENFSHDSFPPASFENDLMLEDSKFPNYVGECGKSLSLSLSLSFPPLSQPFTPLEFSDLAAQNTVPKSSSRLLALDTTAVTNDATIDLILEEANNKTQEPVLLISPISAASAAASPMSFTSKHQTTSPTQGKSSFRSPLTPASAVARFPSCTTSPHGSGEYNLLGNSVTLSDDVRAPRSPPESPERCPPCNRPRTPPIAQHLARYIQSQGSFFGQSSGRFIVPLESSCSFSLLSPFLSYQKNVMQFNLPFFQSAPTVAARR